MTHTSHTPGPWKAHNTNIRGANDEQIAIVMGSRTCGEPTPERLAASRAEDQRDDANARLIAEAPAMQDSLAFLYGYALAKHKYDCNCRPDCEMCPELRAVEAIRDRIEGQG